MPFIQFMLHPQDEFPFLVPPLQHCLTAHALCDNRLQPANASAYWMEISDYFCFLTLPVILAFALATEVICIVVLAKQLRMSLDTYLLGLSVATVLLIACTVLLILQHYVGPAPLLVVAQGYAISCRDWFWYTAIWLIVMMSFERALTVSATRATALCSSTQAGVVVVMVFCVGLVSALPRFWEYQPQAVLDPTTNATVLISRKTAETTTPEYTTMYFWYVKTVTLFLPYSMMLAISITLSCRTRRSVLTRRYMAVKHSAGLTLNRKIKEEIALSKLLVLLISLYVLFSTPLCLLELLANVLPGRISASSRLYASLHNLFSTCFFVHFALHLILYFSYNKQFRLTLLALCCCCC